MAAGSARTPEWAAQGIGVGGFFIGLGQIGPNAVFWPLAAARAALRGRDGGLCAGTRRKVSLQHSPLGLFVLAGVLDVGGNLFFLLAVQNGRLDVTAVLGSLYPAVTALAAWWVIKERMTRFQVLGVGMAVLAIILITL
jgi:drug/metabolite transporter (DMT)-like permease